jgi:hypothetical protein
METPFQWKCQPQAESLLLNLLSDAIQGSPTIQKLQEGLLKETSTRLFDWIDHFQSRPSSYLIEKLEAAGFECTNQVYAHPGAQLPKVVIREEQGIRLAVAVTVERIADYLMARGLHRVIEGNLCGPYRRCLISNENDIALRVVERRIDGVYDPDILPLGYVDLYEDTVEIWNSRPRHFFFDEERGMEFTLHVADLLIENLGRDMGAWIALDGERRYWQLKNTAGQIQKNRQDRLGMGWANHDHHTFRSSRRHFKKLVNLFEKLGFHCRERFYAGEEAGWGAQVMENPRCRLVLFLDVDLAPHEIEIDFAHQELPELPTLGTIGLWCALHGDSILEGGMHHLEAQFMFDELKGDLSKSGVRMMSPFSSFPYLKQAFTQGEIWPVDSRRIQKLLLEGKIDKRQAKNFEECGAIGSHLENLQRREGYKGFNQKNVSVIIKETDPRKLGANQATDDQGRW